MRVQYVHNTDITEHIRRLGIPVDLTLMFYNSNTPRQPNARKLRAAFPDMRICLCGKDSHLSHMVEGNKRLPPSQWKLVNGIADDFIVEPFRDIEIPLAGLLELGYSSHLQWAQQNLVSTPDSDTKVRVSSSSISDVQRDFRGRIRDGTVRTRQMAGHVPYVYQGDTRMYTKKNVRKRKKLFFNRDIGKAIRAFWRVLDLTKSTYYPAFNRLCKEAAAYAAAAPRTQKGSAAVDVAAGRRRSSRAGLWRTRLTAWGAYSPTLGRPSPQGVHGGQRQREVPGDAQARA